jgi:hypothetical protein
MDSFANLTGSAGRASHGDVVQPDSRSELPIACTLGPDDGPARLRRWRAVAEHGQPEASRDGRTLEVRYRSVAGIAPELADLAAAEQQCCSFVTWTVTQEPDQVVLRVVADEDTPDDVAPIAVLFGAA